MASWAEGGTSAVGREQQQRCLACGVRLEVTASGPGAPRCARCLATNRPIDVVMRWIWQSDEYASPPGDAEARADAGKLPG